METDASKEFYLSYFQLTNRNIEMKLKSGKQIAGVIISFIKGDQYSNEPFITAWHIVPSNDSITLGINAFGIMIGEIINHDEIHAIKLLENNRTIHF